MDCGDNSCVFALARGGMRTNGGCRCLDGVAVELRRELQSYVIGVRRDRDTLREQLAVVIAAIDIPSEDASKWAHVDGAVVAEFITRIKQERDELRAIVEAVRDKIANRRRPHPMSPERDDPTDDAIEGVHAEILAALNSKAGV